MHKKISIFSLLFVAISFLIFSQDNQNELLSREILENIGGEVSGKICFEHIRDLSVFRRWYGSDDMGKAAALVVNKAKSYGLSDARIEKFKVDADTYYYMQKPWYAWDCEFGELRVTKPLHKLIASREANGGCVLVYSRDTDIEAEVVYVGQGTNPEDYEGKNVKGKIILAYGSPWEVSKVAIFEKGAAGVLVAWGLDSPGRSSTEVYQTRIRPWNRDRTKFSTFGFFLSTNQGKELLNLLQKGEKVVVQAKVKAEVRVPGYHPGVVATIPGTTYPDEEIIFTAHLDHPRPGAHDNNSGCAVLLETARVIKSLIDKRLIEPPKRTLRFYWTPHVWGCDMLFSSYPDLLTKTIANINIDCVGLNQTKVSSAFTVVRAPHSRASFLDDIFHNVLDYLILTNHKYLGHKPYGPELKDHDGSNNIFYARVLPYVDYSDHIFFNSGSVGIPAIQLIDLPFGSHHSQNDKLELLDPTQLKRISFLAAAGAYTIASAGPEQSYGIIDEIYHRGRTRLEAEMKLAKSILRDSKGKDVAQIFKSAKNLIIHGFKRERQALESTRLFIKKNNNASNYLTTHLSNMKKFDSACLKEIQNLYQEKCSRLGMKAEAPKLSNDENALKIIVPKRDPELKGAWGILNANLEDKYAFGKYSPMNPFFYEMLNLMNGQRNMLEIVQAVKAEALSSNYSISSLKDIMEFLQLFKKAGIISY